MKEVIKEIEKPVDLQVTNEGFLLSDEKGKNARRYQEGTLYYISKNEPGLNKQGERIRRATFKEVKYDKEKVNLIGA